MIARRAALLVTLVGVNAVATKVASEAKMLAADSYEDPRIAAADCANQEARDARWGRR